MRSPYPAPGRNTIFEQIWRAASQWSRTLAPGQQRPITLTYLHDPIGETYQDRWWDLEITEVPVRDSARARRIVEMIEYCPEVATIIDEYVDSTFANQSGDDQGFAIALTLDDNVTPIDPTIYKILNRVIEEVVGGTALDPAAERCLQWGDAFAGIGVDTRKRRIDKLLFLPTWEMFRVETNQGELLGFEQRRSLQDADPIQIHPLTCVHWRYRRKNLYGRSLFLESLEDWEALKDALADLRSASRAIGVNPNLHRMPEGTGKDYLEAYKAAHEKRKREGTITDYYLMCGSGIEKLAGSNPDLSAIIGNIEMRRRRIVMKSRCPLWILGFDSNGAREIAGQPALAMSRRINKLRMGLSAGIKHILNLELALHGYSREQWRYRIIWPKIYVDVLEQQLDPIQAEEANATGVQDLDTASEMSDRTIADWINSLEVNNGRLALEAKK